MNLSRRKFLKISAGVAVAPAVSAVAMSQPIRTTKYNPPASRQDEFTSGISPYYIYVYNDTIHPYGFLLDLRLSVFGNIAYFKIIDESTNTVISRQRRKEDGEVVDEVNALRMRIDPECSPVCPVLSDDTAYLIDRPADNEIVRVVFYSSDGSVVATMRMLIKHV